MDWYAPLTVLPAVGLILISTSNFLVSLNNEIYQLERDMETNEWIIHQKLKQLRRLGIANVFLYSSAVLFMISALTKAFLPNDLFFKSLMVLGTLSITIALITLLIHSIQAVKIRQKHLEL